MCPPSRPQQRKQILCSVTRWSESTVLSSLALWDQANAKRDTQLQFNSIRTKITSVGSGNQVQCNMFICKNYVLLIWNPHLIGHPVFYLHLNVNISEFYSKEIQMRSTSWACVSLVSGTQSPSVWALVGVLVVVSGKLPSVAWHWQ